jgi:transposase
MKKTTLHLGLDVHKDSITVAIAEGRRNGEVRIHSTISNDLHALEKLLARVRKANPGANLEICYEAGPCGFGIARRLTQLGVPCQVIAPSLIPKRSGARSTSWIRR